MHITPPLDFFHINLMFNLLCTPSHLLVFTIVPIVFPILYSLLYTSKEMFEQYHHFFLLFTNKVIPLFTSIPLIIILPYPDNPILSLTLEPHRYPSNYYPAYPDNTTITPFVHPLIWTRSIVFTSSLKGYLDNPPMFSHDNPTITPFVHPLIWTLTLLFSPPH